MTSIKKYLLLGILFIISPLICFASISPTEEFYINDYANILDNEFEETVINLNKQLYAKTGAQIVIVTINDLDGKAIEDVANETFNNFKIGSKDDNGILIILALNDRRVRVEVGYGLEETLNDAKVGRMIDEYMIPYLKENNFSDGIKNGFNAFFNYLLEYYNISDINTQEVVETKDYELDEWISNLITILFIIFILYLVFKTDAFGGGYYGGGGFSSGGFGGSSGGGGASRGF